MNTALAPEKIAQLHAEGQAKVGPFVDPHTINRCKRILRDRGEEWAQSVLLRRFTRRSMICAAFPWLENGEDEILVLADAAEWELLEAAVR